MWAGEWWEGVLLNTMDRIRNRKFDPREIVAEPDTSLEPLVQAKEEMYPQTLSRWFHPGHHRNLDQESMTWDIRISKELGGP
jgi:hypothetical protein